MNHNNIHKRKKKNMRETVRKMFKLIPSHAKLDETQI